MTDGGQSGSVPAIGQGDRWPTAVASLIVGVAFFSLWFWLLPQWLGFRAKWRMQHVGDGWPLFRRCLDLPRPYGVFGISDGQDGARQRPSFRRSDWSWWVYTAMCGIQCTLALQLDGLGFGSSSDTPTWWQSPP